MTKHTIDHTDRETLEYLYRTQNKQQKEIAELAEVPVHCVRHYIRVHGLEERDCGPEREFTREEMIEWLELFVHEFGVVPAYNDLTGWPGPSGALLEYEFGSFSNAIRAAGYEPRGEDK